MSLSAKLVLADADLPRLERFGLWKRNTQYAVTKLCSNSLGIDRVIMCERKREWDIRGFAIKRGPAFRLLPRTTPDDAKLAGFGGDFEILLGDSWNKHSDAV